MIEPVRRVAIHGGGDLDHGDANRGDGDVERDLRDAVETNGGLLTDPADADVVVAVGERALSAAARRDGSVPILPIGTGRFAVPHRVGAAAVEALLDGRGRSWDHPLLTVTVGDREPVGTALFDVTLLTKEPARISEYGVSFPAGRTSTFRGDAVVVATPLGSDGYAGAAEGPTLEPGTGLSVVPVAPFTTRPDAWVVPDRVTLSVERDEEPVSVVLDDRRWGTVPPYEPIVVAATGRIEIVSVPTTDAPE